MTNCCVLPLFFWYELLLKKNILYAMINMKNKSKLKNKTYIQ